MRENSRKVFKNGFIKEKLASIDSNEFTLMKETMLKILTELIVVFDKHNIKYCLGGGSALGAQRHQGYIPWDDDIDINIQRADFEKLRLVFESELGEKYILTTPEDTEGHGLLMSQVKKKDTIYRSFNELSKPDEISGIAIDLFVIENTFDSKLLRYTHGMVSLALGYLTTCRKTSIEFPLMKEYLDESSDAYKAFNKKAIIGKFFFFIPLDTLVKITNRVYSICRDDSTEFVTVPTGRRHFFGELYDRKVLTELKRVPFENLIVNVPVNIDIYLTRLYGDKYMVIPPEVEWEQHDIMQLKL
ncbi:TPA: LicD family protein [Streptococcus suis]|nr:LicD family protein [Streptococcus suis]